MPSISVDHHLLGIKLETLGIGKPLLSWLKSYISVRKQLIKFNGAASNLTQITSGVPHGGHLSPLLFCLFVNSLGAPLFNVEVLLYADDLKFVYKVESIIDCHFLQSQLNIFSKWSYNLGLSK